MPTNTATGQLLEAICFGSVATQELYSYADLTIMPLSCNLRYCLQAVTVDNDDHNDDYAFQMMMS